MKRKRISLKELRKENKHKGYFKSKGFTTIKHTFINKKGEQESELLEFEIQPLGGHPLIKKYVEDNPEPKPPVKRELIHPDTGRSVLQDKVSPQSAKAEGYKWTNVFDYTDEEYLKKRKDYIDQIRILQIMISFGDEEEFGIDKIDEYEKELDYWGFSPHQLNKIGEDIKNLDFFTEKSD